MLGFQATQHTFGQFTIDRGDRPLSRGLDRSTDTDLAKIINNRDRQEKGAESQTIFSSQSRSKAAGHQL